MQPYLRNSSTAGVGKVCPQAVGPTDVFGPVRRPK